ncbi:hypothetical protein ACOSQ4_010372 [Xanthoceras sorbifolium]
MECEIKLRSSTNLGDCKFHSRIGDESRSKRRSDPRPRITTTRSHSLFFIYAWRGVACSCAPPFLSGNGWCLPVLCSGNTSEANGWQKRG